MNYSIFEKNFTTLCLFLFTTSLYCQNYYIERIQHKTFVTDSNCFSTSSIDRDWIGYVFCIDQMYFSDMVVDTTKVMFIVDFEMRFNNTCGVDTILLKDARIFSFNKSISLKTTDISDHDFYIEALRVILNQGYYCYFFDEAYRLEQTLSVTESFFIPITFLPQDNTINKPD